MVMDTRALEKKWITRWEDARIFEATADITKPKFFVNAPYPYVNSFPHIGHLYTYMRTEAFARYKRLRGFNVLFPQGFHATGSPIVSAAKRVKEKEPKQIQLLKNLGIKEEELIKFEDPAYWIEFFEPEFINDFKSMGFGIDWRRSFHTTSLNPHYDKFVRWQFDTLKKKGYVVQEPFPVVWDPLDNCPVGDHDRSEGEGETPKDFIWVKFRMKDSDLILMTGTTRPDALLAQTHLWIDPKATYKIVQVKDEKWVVGEEAVEKIRLQYSECEEIGEVPATDLMGKWVKGPLVDYDLYVVPAWFIDAKVGSGIVYSALEDPVDLIEIQDIQNDLEKVKEYHLDLEVVKKLKPIFIIDVPELGENLGQEMIDKYQIKNATEKKKIKDAKDELNKTVFRKGVMKKHCGKYAGMTVPDAQEAIKADLINANDGVMFYELTGKVVSRSLHECTVKIVTDQWFIKYGDEKWKKQVHKAFKGMKLYPDKSRAQFEYVIDWLHNWACTREHGLGTRLPWDEKWLIESLSDSTIYMAYYTIMPALETLPIEKVDNALFDYIFLGIGEAPSKEVHQMHEAFNYWYPFDFRNSGKDLIQNHLAFCVFNHTAIFPEKHWPVGFGVNGWVTVDGEKMSKSKGNIIALRDMPHKFSVDSARFTILSGGEELDDPNWDSNFARGIISKLENLHRFSVENYNKGRDEYLAIDKWMESQLNEIIEDVSKAMDETLFRTATQRAFFDLQHRLRWYLRRTRNNPNKELMNTIIETQLIMLAPICPFICEESWEAIGKNKTGDLFITNETWPKVDEKKIDRKLDNYEQTIRTVVDDIGSVFKIAKIDNAKKITLFISDDWKYMLFDYLNVITQRTRHPGEVLKELMALPELKKYGQQISKMVPRLLKSSKINAFMKNAKDELKLYKDTLDFFTAEYGCEFEFVLAEETDHPKAKNALPEKPAILVE